MTDNHKSKGPVITTTILLSITALFVLYLINTANGRKSEAAQTKERISTTSEVDKEFTMKPIGIFHSPYSPEHRPPRQGRLAPEVTATIEIFEEFEEGLEGVEDFDCIYVLFAFDRSRGWRTKVTPSGASKPRGVFATRSPNRPNPIGLTAVRLEKREGRILHVKGIDAFDKTPVLDIKPYIGSIDSFPDAGKNVEKDLGLK